MHLSQYLSFFKPAPKMTIRTDYHEAPKPIYFTIKADSLKYIRELIAEKIEEIGVLHEEFEVKLISQKVYHHADQKQTSYEYIYCATFK